MRNRVVALALLFSPAIASGQSSTQTASTILLFPLVAADGNDDTVIQLSNTGNSMSLARCFYVASQAGVLQTTDFAIALTRQQPTEWVASRGRAASANDRCSAENLDCAGAGLDPGFDPVNQVSAAVPAAPSGFRGALVCTEIDESGFPISGNHFTGQATVVLAGGSAFTYEATGLSGFDFGPPSNTLVLGGSGPYAGCPTAPVLNHLAEGSTDDLLGAGSTVATTIVAMACSLDLTGSQAASVDLQFQVTTDFEQVFSTSTTVQGWAELRLSEIDPAFDVGTLGSSVVRSRISSSPGGAAIVGMEVRSIASQSGAASMLLHRGDEQRDDAIVLPNL